MVGLSLRSVVGGMMYWLLFLIVSSIYSSEIWHPLATSGFQAIPKPVILKKGVETNPLEGGLLGGSKDWSKARIRLSVRKWVNIYSLYWEDSYPWYWQEGLIKAESHYNQDAVSPVGARGLGQFMPNTWEEVSMEVFGDVLDVHHPSYNIQGSVWYVYRLRAVYKTPRPEKEKHSMALCSYNAGLGNCIQAQRLCSDTLLWSEAKVCLPAVTGHHSNETIQYVDRIWKYSDEICNEVLGCSKQ